MNYMREKIHLEVHLEIEGNRTLHRASFDVNKKEFEKDAEFTAGVVAYQWIDEIKRENGYRDTIIELVNLNNKEDITETVKKIRPVLPPDDLPF